MRPPGECQNEKNILKYYVCNYFYPLIMLFNDKDVINCYLIKEDEINENN